MNLPATTIIAKHAECPSLADSGLSLSTFDVMAGTIVHLECTRFGHRPTDDVYALACLSTGEWMPSVPSCKWSWNFSTREKITFGTLVSAATFIIIVSIAAFIAYIRCYRRRRAVDMKTDAFNHQPETKSRPGYKVYNLTAPSSDVTYHAYEEVISNKMDGYRKFGVLNSLWLGYIPRPKVTGDYLHK